MNGIHERVINVSQPVLIVFLWCRLVWGVKFAQENLIDSPNEVILVIKLQQLTDDHLEFMEFDNAESSHIACLFLYMYEVLYIYLTRI